MNIFKHIKRYKCLWAIPIVGFLFGFTVVQARIIPGWDEPWDPPNYYSEETISWADTNNPSFFYRDLGWNGYHVHDTNRINKLIDTVKKYTGWEDTANAILNLKIINSTPLGQALSSYLRDVISKRQHQIQKINQYAVTDKVLGTPYLATTSSIDKGLDEYDYKARGKLIQDAMSEYADGAQNAIKDEEESIKALDDLLERAQNAKGEMELRQIMAEINALKEAEIAKRNAMYANLAGVDSVKKRIQVDKEIQTDKLIDENKLIIMDPYDDSELAKKQYERPEPKGFVKFDW